MGEWFVDMHSHILPGLDDGSPDLETSVEMARIAWNEGIGTIVCTPHNMPRKGHASLPEIEEKIELLAKRMKAAGIDICFLAGCEQFYRASVQEALETGEAVTLNGTDLVLVEFDPTAERSYILNALQSVMGEEYQPVLAHVERYPALEDRGFETIRGLREQGVLIQANCASLTGDFGPRAKRLTRALAKEELLDFVSTDAHSAGHRAPLMQACAKWLYRACGRAYAQELLFENAREWIL